MLVAFTVFFKPIQFAGHDVVGSDHAPASVVPLFRSIVSAILPPGRVLFLTFCLFHVSRKNILKSRFQ